MMYTVIILILLHFIRQTISDPSSQCGICDVYKDGNCFKIFKNQPLTYDEAIDLCHRNDGSSLLSIRSQEEQNFIFNILKVYGINNDVWLEANSLTNNSFVNYSKRPNDSTDINNENLEANSLTIDSFVNYSNSAIDSTDINNGNDCVKMLMTEPDNGKWIDVDCDMKNLVVCEKRQNRLMGLKSSNEPNFIDRNEFEIFKSQLETKLENTINEIKSTKLASGTIAYFANSKEPEGWLKANGDLVSRVLYSNLFATIGTTYGSGDGTTTFSLPDLRGEFIRGWNDGRDVDKNRTFGSFQWGSTIPMAGYISGQFGRSYSSAHHDRWGFAGKSFDDGFENNVASGQTRNGITYPNDNHGNHVYYGKASTGGCITTWNILKGTRPRNIALLACIKY